MRTDDEIHEELSKMTLPQLFERCSNLMARVGVINRETGKPPTANELFASCLRDDLSYMFFSPEDLK